MKIYFSQNSKVSEMKFYQKKSGGLEIYISSIMPSYQINENVNMANVIELAVERVF